MYILVVNLLPNASLCPVHNEAKQTEKLEFGAEKGLLQGHARRQVVCAPKSTDLLEEFQQRGRGGGYD